MKTFKEEHDNIKGRTKIFAKYLSDD